MSEEMSGSYIERLAGKSRRIIIFVVDMFAWFIFLIALTKSLLLLGFDQTISDSEGDEYPVVFLALMVPAYWFYYIFCEYVYQKTLGSF